MLKDDAIRMRHMLDAAIEAEDFVRDKDRNDFDNDRKLELAHVKCIEIIGEATNSISKGCQDEFPQIPWANIIGMRNRLIHAYFEINLDILWKTLTDDIPPLIFELKKIIQP